MEQNQQAVPVTINLSMTASPDFFPTEFWTDTCGTCANQTQIYPDVDLSNNSLVWCPDELPPTPLYPGCMDINATNQIQHLLASYDPRLVIFAEI